jgi:putative ABC transport system permease protein
MSSPVWPLLQSFSRQELLQHPWRNAAALLSVMLGVALALCVHLINASALDEFSQALRSTGGQPDLQLRSQALDSNLDESVLGLLHHRPEVALASPVLELSTYALPSHDDSAKNGSNTQHNQRVLLRIVGVDPLQIAMLAPDLMPLPATQDARTDLFAPDSVFLNAAASNALGHGKLQLQQGLQLKTAHITGSVRASGSPLAVMDIAAAQDFFNQVGQLSRVDIRLQPGADRNALVRALLATPGWNPAYTLTPPGDATERIGDLSRAYRVNLTVLALIALFTGGFLVFSVLTLSVTRRAQQFALLGVLGLTGRQCLQLVLLESGVLGLMGSALGVAVGTGLAALALRLLGGDLGGGYFAGSTPALQWNAWAALFFASMGVVTALLGGWWPARLAQALPPAQTLKGLGALHAHRSRAWAGPALLLTGAALAFVPPLWGMPLGAYVGIGLLLIGGIASLPWLVGLVLDRVVPWLSSRLLPLLAVERARRIRHSAAVAVSGVVAALSLAVALTVMVSSFRQSVTLWLDTVLPASLYVRASSSGSANAQAYFDPAFVEQARSVPGVERLGAQRTLPLNLNAGKPTVALMVRSLQGDNATELPLLGPRLPVPPGAIGIYVSEAMLDLYHARLGETFLPLDKAFAGNLPGGGATPAFFVADVWRDYARQFGTIAMDRADFARLSSDQRVNDLALWLTPGADAGAVEQALRDLAERLGSASGNASGSTSASTSGSDASQLLEFSSAANIRATTLRIFDRSFAVTYWLQAVAVGIGLFGVAASFSAQVLARRKEFGLLAHLGLTRPQILRLVAMEGAAWTTLGAIAGVALGLAVALVLVYVVNPQSFHWTMDLCVPWWRLLALAASVVVAGTVTAWLSGQAAAEHDAVMAVKEDW